MAASFHLISQARETKNGEREDADEEDREHHEQAGDLLEASERAAQEGLRALGSL